MKKILFAIIATAVLTACNKDKEDEPKPEVKADRTVLLYMSGECSLWDFVEPDLNEMKTGSMTIGNNNLLVYVDRGNTKEIPWLARIREGQFVDSVSIKDIVKEMNLTPAQTSVTDDPYSSEGQVMEGVIRYAFKKYPSKNNDYALAFFGHGSGWLMKDSVAYTAMGRKKAYGIDNGRNAKDDSGKWLNIPTMAKLLSKLPHLTYMFFDCCNMMCLEDAYELRNVTDYLIGSPAEIPAVGAPYITVVPAMFEKTTFWKSIVDRYFEQRASGYDVPLSVVKTSEMENLASATRTVLKAIAPKLPNPGDGYPDMTGLIHYYYDYSYEKEFYDANDFILKYAEPDDYNSWKQALDKAVIYKKMATSWMINKSSWLKYYGNYFTVTEEKYGGVSMFVPTYIQRTSDNNYIQRMGWYYAAGYNEIGW
ncbi:MAG: lipoprotein [Prevotella sp.]|nr:lipoprotein [Prevotella sp.]